MIVIRRSWLIVICLFVGMALYHAPWYSHETAGFTMNAFDLAEWSSLHPAVRSSSPPMLTSFLLRVPFVALVVACALVANRPQDPRKRWLLRLAAVLLALRMVPPTDFFTEASDDPNYRQMALLTGLGIVLILATLPLHRVDTPWQMWLLVGVLLAGVIAGWFGLSRAGTLLDNFEIDVQVGFGAVGLSAAAALAAFFAVVPKPWVLWALDSLGVPVVHEED